MNIWKPLSEEPVTLEEFEKDVVDVTLFNATKPKRVKTKLLDDPVNNPAHYTVGGIETIDYIKAKLTPEEFVGYLKGNVIKYTSRAGKKVDQVQDLEKAQWYMNRQIKELKGETK
jgi:hypothetical protein